MTKTEKKQIISAHLLDFIQSESASDSEHLIENVIKEIYSSGFKSIGQLKIVSDAITIFLGDIVNNTFNRNTKNWQTIDSIVAILSLIEISTLPD